MMTREQKQIGDPPDGEQFIARMDAIRNASERHVVRMRAEAERLADWREYVRAQPLLAMAVASAAGFLLMVRVAAPAQSTPKDLFSKQAESGGDAARTTLASGAMAFVGTIVGNLVKQTVSNYVKNQLAGGQHDRRDSKQAESREEVASGRPSRW